MENLSIKVNSFKKQAGRWIGNPTVKNLALFAALAVVMAGCAAEKETSVVMVTGAARNVTRMTQNEQDETNPSVSPDGKTVAFQVLKDNQYNIWTMDSVTGRNSIQATSYPCYNVEPSWLQDNKTLVFASNRLGNYALWKQLASGGGGCTMITGGGDMNDFAPCGSPKGKRIAFTSKGTVKEVIVTTGAAQYTVFEKKLPYIWTVNMDGSELTQLVQGAFPIWSPDGTRILFSSNISGSWNIWVVNADGSGLTQLTSAAKNNFAPSFSPDGNWIVYSSNISGNYNIWIMKQDGSARTQVTTDKSEAVTPCWGSDNNIYFACNKTGHWNIWRLTPVLPE